MEEKNLESLIEESKKATAELRVYLAEQAEITRKNTTLSNWLSVVILLVVLVFVFQVYHSLSNNLKVDNFRASLQKHSPAISKVLVEVATRVYPTYVDLAKTKVAEVAPRWAELITQETDALGKNLNQTAHKRMETALMNVFSKPTSGVKKSMSDISPEDMQAAIQKMDEDLKDDFVLISDRMVDRSMGSITALNKTLDKFDTSGLPNDEIKLSKLFVHDLLMSLDKELMEVK
jgi:hypothetical protein